MGLAKYFQKDVLALSKIAKFKELNELKELLNSHIIELAFDDDIQTSEGECTADMVIRLLSRFYPIIKITDLSNHNSNKVTDLISLAKTINNEITISNENPTISLIIGKTFHLVNNHQKKIFIGSDYWNVKLSLKGPVGSKQSGIPFAAGLSACIGVSNVFRIVFSDLLEEIALDDDLKLSLISFDNDNDQNNNLENLDINEVILVGFGAIGNGFIWALSKINDLNGKLIIVDGENLEQSNLQRYCLTQEDQVGKSKVLIAKNFINNGTLEVNTFKGNWDEFLNSTGNWFNKFVCVSIDNAEDRIRIQSSLPYQILNSWTDVNRLGISKHYDFLESPCLACEYMPHHQSLSKSQIVANSLKLPNREKEIRDYLAYERKLDLPLLTLIAQANSVQLDDLMEFQDLTLEQFFTEKVCGGYFLIDNTNDSRYFVPLSFQSAIAGILLAMELIMSITTIRSSKLQNHYQIFPLNKFEKGGNPIFVSIDKDNTGHCICNDSIFRERYIEKYNLKNMSK